MGGVATIRIQIPKNSTFNGATDGNVTQNFTIHYKYCSVFFSWEKMGRPRSPNFSEYFLDLGNV